MFVGDLDLLLAWGDLDLDLLLDLLLYLFFGGLGLFELALTIGEGDLEAGLKPIATSSSFCFLAAFFAL